VKADIGVVLGWHAMNRRRHLIDRFIGLYSKLLQTNGK